MFWRQVPPPTRRRLASQLQWRFMIVDTRLFRYRPSADFAEWRDQNIIPRYNRAGVRKFAFLTPPGVGAASEPAPEGPAQFPTGYFDSRERIDAWLSP